MPPRIAIVGATATGKSALAVAVARRHGGEVVNADALQVYRGLEIGTAKPAPELRAAAPHHLFDLLAPEEGCSAAWLAELARSALGEIAARGRPAILVGGGGFYLQAILDGLGPVPPTPPEVRELWRDRLEREGLPALAAELARRDPATASRLSPGDRHRILRALEVEDATGEPLSAWHARGPIGASPLAALRIGLTLPRALLYDRIEQRVREMIAAGWVDEVERLLAAGVAASAPAFQALGYREIVAVLEGRMRLAEAEQRIVKATRRYAKRQQTWFRRDPRIRWFDARESDGAVHFIAAFMSGEGEGVEP
ncbi:MAG TPA: tRNA (adenosine(37)-N6)-dimethylallyltransferase MiaA [Thermoanaerobaculia bacterium]|nr:tRNA (adenosine(37)-N6)-dimethylallyltransferase MiaA [Thermoanaerobaculia bacterium]